MYPIKDCNFRNRLINLHFNKNSELETCVACFEATVVFEVRKQFLSSFFERMW